MTTQICLYLFFKKILTSGHKLRWAEPNRMLSQTDLAGCNLMWLWDEIRPQLVSLAACGLTWLPLVAISGCLWTPDLVGGWLDHDGRNLTAVKFCGAMVMQPGQIGLNRI